MSVWSSRLIYIVTCSGCAWLTRRVLDWMLRFIDTLYTQLGTTGNYSAITIPTLYSSPLRTHWGPQPSLVLSWQRIYSYNSLTVTSDHTWVSLHRLIPFLPLFCNCQFRRLDSVQFFCSQAHNLAGWRLKTRLTRLTLLKWTLIYDHFARTTQKTQSLCCREGVFAEPLHSIGSYSTVACVFVGWECVHRIVS
jgi:hypothetical protein